MSALSKAYVRAGSCRRTRLATAGFGSPRGFHETKTSTEPMRRMGPKPLNMYPRYFWIVLDLGGEGALRPNSLYLLATCSLDMPWEREEPRRRMASSVVMVCHSNSEISVLTGSALSCVHGV